MSDAMDTVMAQLSDTRAMVVDVRLHEGGWDQIGLDIAERFDGPATVAWRTAQRNGPAHTDLTEFSETTIAATRRGYSEPVVLLTSGATFSAGETFVFAMQTRAHVTVLGEPTSGHLSDLYEVSLRRGFRTTFSGDLYQAPSGELYEGVGIPPDVEVAFDVDALNAGRDEMLERAFDRFP